MRARFDQENMLLTAAVSAGYKTIDRGYDIPAMAATLHYINVMTYDYHGWWDGHTFTGHNSPMYALDEEVGDDEHPGYRMNSDYSMKYWIDGGARRDQLLLGMGAYGRGFRLTNPADNGFYAPASGPCEPGKYTGTGGINGYNEFCEKLYVNGELSLWTKVRVGSAASSGLNGDLH